MEQATTAPSAAPAAQAPAAAPQQQAPAASASQAMTQTAPSSEPADWRASFNPDLKGYIENKGFKGPDMLAESYRNLEKLVGVPQDQIIKMPSRSDDPAWGDVYSKLGKPAAASEYKFVVPEGQSPEFANQAKEMFFKANLTSNQAEQMVNIWNENQKAAQQQNEAQLNLKRESETQTLRQEKGPQYDEFIHTAKSGAQALGLKPEMIDALEKTLGFAGLMKQMESIGKKVGESKFVMGESNSGPMTQHGAQNKIASLMKDPAFVNRYINGDAAAREEMNRLNAIVAPGETSF